MAKKYITAKTARLYEQSTGAAWHMVLIYGDEVKTNGNPSDGRVPVKFRGREGFVKEDQLGNKPVLEMYFIDVGQGDATFIITPNRKTILIDGGVNPRALGFLIWKYNLDLDWPNLDIDLMVLSHADGDHIKGLIPVLKHPRISVKKIIHNGIATYKSGKYQTGLGKLDSSGEYLVTHHDTLDDLTRSKLSDEFGEWYDVIKDKNIEYGMVTSDTGTLDIGDPGVSIDILGPRPAPITGGLWFPWLGNESKTINGHSVTLRLNCGLVSAFFPGDINESGADFLMEDGSLVQKLNSHIFKVPHHGSHDFSPKFFAAIRPQISIISSGDTPDHGHPRAVLIGAVGKYSRSEEPLVFSTELAATFVMADATTTDSEHHRLFKLRLHGMVNVRTDGQKIYSARRVNTGYWWESYGGINPAV